MNKKLEEKQLKKLSLSVLKNKIDKGEFFFDGYKFEENIELIKLIFNKDIIFNNCHFKSNFNLSSSNCNSYSINFDRCIFNLDFTYSSNKNNGTLKIKSCDFYDSINIYGFLNKYDDLSLLNTLLINDSNFNEINIRDIFFKEITFYNNKRILDNIYSKIKISFDYITIRELSYSRANFSHYDTIILFSKITDIDKISILGNNQFHNLSIEYENTRFNNNKDSYYYFYGKSIKKIFFTNCINLSDFFELSDIKNVILFFDDVNFGKALFNSLIINKIFIKDCVLNNCIFNGVEFPKNYKLEEKNDTDKLSNNQLKDNYRQLKFVMDKNGNYTEANKFYEKDMEYHMKSLNIEKISFIKYLKKLNKVNFTGFETKKLGEKISLIFGFTINEFGNNWIKPLQLIIALALFSTIFDGLSTQSGYYFGNNYLGDFLFLLFGIIVVLILSFISGTTIDTKIDNFFKKKFTIIFILFITILFLFLIKDFDPLKVFGNLLNPLYLKEKGVIYNGIEILGLTLYKTFYGILLWHLVVALKRTTKR